MPTGLVNSEVLTPDPEPGAPSSEAAQSATRNIRLTLAYDGTDFHGWQRQPGLSTIQETVEEAIGRVIGEPAGVCGAGRTDAGVHALGQVAHFRTSCPIPCANLVKALNDTLPPAVRVCAAGDALPGFHARYDARSKVYRYSILQAEIAMPFLSRYAYHYPHRLDAGQMDRGAALFKGEHDFTSFAAAGEEGAGSKVRTILSSRWRRRSSDSMLIYEVCGTGFLHHMVRNIVGTLIEVGSGRLSPAQVAQILEARDRTLAGPTAPPQGLCLVKVEYGKE